MEKYIIGFYEYDGSFCQIVKKGKPFTYNTWDEASKKAKELQPKYKHQLSVWRER